MGHSEWREQYRWNGELCNLLFTFTCMVVARCFWTPPCNCGTLQEEPVTRWNFKSPHPSFYTCTVTSRSKLDVSAGQRFLLHIQSRYKIFFFILILRIFLIFCLLIAMNKQTSYSRNHFFWNTKTKYSWATIPFQQDNLTFQIKMSLIIRHKEIGR